MRSDWIGQALILALVVVAVAMGLYFTGGPERGRMEKRDQERQRDLRSLQRHVTCLAETEGKTLPTSLSDGESCSLNPYPTDPVTGEAYRYERIDDTSYRLCASFEQDGEVIARYWPAGAFDPETGCVNHWYEK